MSGVVPTLLDVPGWNTANVELAKPVAEIGPNKKEDRRWSLRAPATNGDAAICGKQKAPVVREF
jgi:hypothetical protein